MSRFEDPDDDDFIEYDDGGDRGEACARLREEVGDWDEPITHAPDGEVFAEPVPQWDLRAFDDRLEKLDADGIWRPLWP